MSDVDELRRQVEEATSAARDAYRDTVRLIRLLSVIGQPSTDRLLDQSLATFCEVFFADVTALTRRVGDRLLLRGACGVAEDDPAWREGWPVAEQAAAAFDSGASVVDDGELSAGLPAQLAPLDIRSAAWVPTSSGSGADLLVLLRRRPDPFTRTETQVLDSVAARLGVALAEQERRRGVERLARHGHRLARHLELAPLLDEAVELLRLLTEADQVWLVTFEGELARVSAHRNLPEEALAGWPRPRDQVDDWRPPAPPPDRVPAVSSAGRMSPQVLRIPVSRHGTLTAVLFAARWGQPLAAETPELNAIFANHLSVSMVNTELYRALRRRATHDPLTGLANRTLANQRLEESLRTGGRDRVGLLFCDLDRFKAVNDLLGHEAGDELLRQVAERLRGTVRRDDLLTRFGGDEFLIVLPRVRDLTEVAEVGRRIVDALDRDFLVRGERVRITSTVGGVLGVPGESSPGVMMRNADAAMYAAKDRGTGQVEVFDEAASHRALDRLDLRSDLTYALERGQFELTYQPIVATGPTGPVAFEARLRWRHPRHGWVSPQVFLPMAEDTGMMTSIGVWQLEQACRQVAEWRRLPGGERLAVNVDTSAVQLRQPGATDRLLGAVRAAGLAPADVWLDLAVSGGREEEEVLDPVATLRAAGVRFVIGHFGAAYTAVRFLRQLAGEIVKIDLSVIPPEATRWEDPRLLRAIMEVVRSVGLTPLGEGVGSPEQLAALRTLACPLALGDLFSPPVPAREAAGLVGRPLAPPPVNSPGTTPPAAGPATP